MSNEVIKLTTDEPYEALRSSLPGFELPEVDKDQLGDITTLEAEKIHYKPGGYSLETRFIEISRRKRGKAFRIIID